MGWGRTISFMPYGELWQMHRKLLQTTFSNSSVGKWHDLQTREARRTVKDLLEHPESWEVSLRRFAVAIVLKVSYGVDVTDDHDPYVCIANDAMYATGNGGTLGNSIVDFFPLGKALLWNLGCRAPDSSSSSTLTQLSGAGLGAEIRPRLAMGYREASQCSILGSS